MGCGAREKEGRREVSQVCCFVGVFSHDTGYNKGNRVSREWGDGVGEAEK